MISWTKWKKFISYLHLIPSNYQKIQISKLSNDCNDRIRYIAKTWKWIHRIVVEGNYTFDLFWITWTIIIIYFYISNALKMEPEIKMFTLKQSKGTTFLSPSNFLAQASENQIQKEKNSRYHFWRWLYVVAGSVRRRWGLALWHSW